MIGLGCSLVHWGYDLDFDPWPCSTGKARSKRGSERAATLFVMLDRLLIGFRSSANSQVVLSGQFGSWIVFEYSPFGVVLTKHQKGAIHFCGVSSCETPPPVCCPPTSVGWCAQLAQDRTREVLKAASDLSAVGRPALSFS